MGIRCCQRQQRTCLWHLLHSHKSGMLSPGHPRCRPPPRACRRRRSSGRLQEDTRLHSHRCRRCLRPGCNCLHNRIHKRAWHLHNRKRQQECQDRWGHHIRPSTSSCRRWAHHIRQHSWNCRRCTHHTRQFRHTDKTHPRWWLLHCSCMRCRPCSRTPSRIAGSPPRHQNQRISGAGWPHLQAGTLDN